MEKVSKATVAKKGNKTTEIIIGAGAAKLTGAVTTLMSVVEKIQELPQIIQEKTLEVTNLEDKIGGLQQEFENKKNQNDLDLKLAYETSKEGFVGQYLNANGLETIKGSELADLKRKAYQSEAEIEQQIQTAVGKAVGIEKANSANALKIAQLEHQNKEANNSAEITQLKQQNAFLTQQVADWKKALEDERAAGIKRAEAGAIHNLSIGGTQQGR